MTIENYSEQIQKTNYSMLKLILVYIENIKSTKSNGSDIQNYLYYCATKMKYSYSSMKHVIATISYLYSKILYKPIPKALYLKLRKPPTPPAILSVRDISKILDVAKNLKHKAMLLLFYLTGLRLNELLELRMDDLDSETMRIHV